MTPHQRIRAVLAGFALVSEGNTTRFPDAIRETPADHRRVPPDVPRQRIGSKTQRQHGESRPPAGHESLHDFWERRLARAQAIGGPALLMAIEEAEIALQVAKKRPEMLPSKEDERDKLIIACVGMTPEAVAARFRCSPAHVRTLRVRWPDDPRHPETGEPFDPTKHEQNVAQAREYVAQGLSARQVAIRMGVPKSTVARWLSNDGSRAA